MTPRRTLIALALPLVAASPASAATDRAAARAGAAWLARQPISTTGQQADAIVVMAANGWPAPVLRRRLGAMAPGAPAYAVTTGAAGKVVLAAVAARTDPRRLRGVNYVARIRAGYGAGRFGASTYDHAYALLALRAAGERIPAQAVAAAKAARGAGGWGYAMSPRVRDDVSATGLMVEALRAAGVARSDPALRSATAWLIARRNPAGGFAIDGGSRPTEANSTAIAVRAIRAMGIRPAPATVRSLRSLQERDGGWRFTARVRESRLLATADAALALSGRTLPPPYPLP